MYRLLLAQQQRQHIPPIVTSGETFSKRTQEHGECVPRAIGVLLSRRDADSFRWIICSTDSSRETREFRGPLCPCYLFDETRRNFKTGRAASAAALMKFAQRMELLRSIPLLFQIA